MCIGKRGVFMHKLYIKIFFFIALIITISPFIYCINVNEVEVTNICTSEYQRKLDITGEIESYNAISIKLSYPVYIKECLVSENSYVNKGQLLFVLDTERMSNAVNDNTFTSAAANNIKVDGSVWMNIPEEIYATESGTVCNINAQSGSLVLADENLCVIDKDNSLVLKITVSQDNYDDILVGDRVEFIPVIAPARKYTATISEKTAVIRKENTLIGNNTVIDIFADIDDADNFLINGIQCYGTITGNDKNKIYTLPYEYVQQDDAGEYVNIYQDGIIIKKYVKTGIETQSEVEIDTFFDDDTLFVKNKINGKLLLNYDN